MPNFRLEVFHQPRSGKCTDLMDAPPPHLPLGDSTDLTDVPLLPPPFPSPPTPSSSMSASSFSLITRQRRQAQYQSHLDFARDKLNPLYVAVLSCIGWTRRRDVNASTAWPATERNIAQCGRTSKLADSGLQIQIEEIFGVGHGTILPRSRYSATSTRSGLYRNVQLEWITSQRNVDFGAGFSAVSALRWIGAAWSAL